MKLAVAIIQDQYINKVAKALMAEKFSITKLSSTGGFLKSGNTTLLIGVDDERVDSLIELIDKQCHSTSFKDGEQEFTVGGANIFIMNIDQYLKI